MRFARQQQQVSNRVPEFPSCGRKGFPASSSSKKESKWTKFSCHCSIFLPARKLWWCLENLWTLKIQIRPTHLNQASPAKSRDRQARLGESEPPSNSRLVIHFTCIWIRLPNGFNLTINLVSRIEKVGKKVSQIWHLWKAFILQSKKVNKAIFNPRQNRIPTFIWHDLFCSLNRWPKKLALSTTFLSTCAPNLEQAQWVLLLSGNRKKLHTFCWWWLSPIFIIFSLGWDEKLSRLKFHY